MKTSHRISILGRDIQVRSNASPEAVQEVEEFVNRRVAEVAVSLPNADQQLVALLAMLNIAESYLALKRDVIPDESREKAVVERVLAKIDVALGEGLPRRVNI